MLVVDEAEYQFSLRRVLLVDRCTALSADIMFCAGHMNISYLARCVMYMRVKCVDFTLFTKYVSGDYHRFVLT